MTFTYTEDLTVDRDFVRFHTHDTIADESELSDEIITSLLATESSKQAVVIAGLRYKLQNLIRPDVKADWLDISAHAAAVKAMRQEIRDKETELGVGRVSAGSVTYTYRADSNATEEPYTS